MFSVIIPVFNAEKTINKTMKSILDSIENMEHEIIVINDGSTDDTLIKLDEWKNNEYIKVLNQENLGVSAARNNGLSAISQKSEFVTFIDDSDSISEDFFQQYVNFFNKYNYLDVAVCKIERIINGIETGHSLNYRFLDKDREIVDIFDDYNLIHFHIGGAVFRSTIFLDEEYRFDEKISFWEDAKLINTILLEKRIYGLVSSATYFYDRSNRNSLSFESWNSVDRYNKHIRRNYFYLINKSLRTYNTVIPYVQYLIASHYIQYIIESNKDKIKREFIVSNNDFLKESRKLFKNIDLKIIDELKALPFYKAVLYKVKTKEMTVTLPKENIEVLGQSYNFLNQEMTFSFTNNYIGFVDNLRIYRKNVFGKEVLVTPSSYKKYKDPLFGMVNFKHFKVKLYLYEAFFKQVFIIYDVNNDINIKIKSPSLFIRFLKRFLK